MFKKAFYAMDLKSLEKYAEFKDKISLESVNLSTSEIKRISAEVQGERSANKKMFTVDENGTAFITVAGPLEPKADICAIMFDIEMTTYQDIIIATNEAEADDNIKDITYLFDTPGGNVVGLFKTADVIRNTSKPTKAIVYGMCASAGYALASQCNTIEVENISNEIGSIGVATEIQDNSKQAEGMGIVRYVLTSANAENKRPDVTTEEGRDKIVTRLTDLESVFIEYVALGRDTTIENVKANFGRGGIMLSRKALELGMVDKIQSELPTSNTSSQNNTNTETNTQGDKDTMEMSKEDIAKIVGNATETAMLASEKRFDAKLEARDKASTAETERKAGFITLSTNYPEMSAMINEEMAKPEATANADFFVKVAAADKARLSALDEQNTNSGDNVETVVKPGAEENTEAKTAEADLAEMSAMSGIDLSELGGK